MSEFVKELQNCINRHSQENVSNTPDYILATFLENCLKAWNDAIQQRERFYQKENVRPELWDDI